MFKWFLTLVVMITLGVLLIFSVRVIPPEHNPLEKLNIDDPIGMATHSKIAHLRGDADACYAFLDESFIQYTRLDDSKPGEPCGFYNALTLDRSAFPYNAGLRMTCPVTAGLVVWEQQSLVLRAEEYLGTTPVRVLSYGSYSCRRLYGRKTGRYSEHARGNAVDITGFELRDGRRITVANDWGKKTPEGKFLKAIRNDACRVFSTVLGPEYNDAHADHFHLDMGGGGVCS